MRFVREEPFRTVIRKPFALRGVKGDPEASTEEATNSEILHWLLSMYSPQIAGPLQVGDLRKLNRAIEVLEGPPDERGFYAFETADYDLAQRVAVAMASALSPRNAPLVDDLLSAAPTEVGLHAVRAKEA